MTNHQLPSTSLTNTFVIRATNVNGGTDNVLSNNTIYKNIPFAATADSLNMQMKFVQDRYGSESSWAVINEATSATVTSGGPYTNLASNGTLAHIDNFMISTNSCYKLKVMDAYGDGINNGYGVGYYELRSGTGLNSLLITSNGQYGSGETNLFTTKTAGTNTTVLATGINAQALNIRSVSVYPNPTSGLTNIAVDLSQNENISVSVMNSMGQLVYASKASNFAAGSNVISLDTQNWANGVYFVNVSTLNGATKTKLVVSNKVLELI